MTEAPAHPENAPAARSRACRDQRGVPCFEVSWRSVSLSARWKETSSLATRGKGDCPCGPSCEGGASLPDRSGPQEWFTG